MGELADLLGSEGHWMEAGIYPSADELAQAERRREEERYHRECGPVKVYKLGAEEGAVYIMPALPERKLSPKDLTKEVLIAEVRKGLTAWKIGEKYGMSINNVQYRKRKWGLTRKGSENKQRGVKE